MLFDLTLAAFLMLTVFLSALMFFSRRGLSGLGIVLLLPLLLVLCFAVFGGLVPSLGVSTLGAVLSQQVLGINSTLQLSFLFSATLTAVAYLVLTLTRPRQTTTPVLLSLSVVIVASVCLLCTQHFLVIFLSFELLLLSSLLLLRLTSKSERVLEAVMEMFLWTLVGSLGLFFAFTSLWARGVTTLGGLADTVGFLDLFTSLCLLLGFGVKVPVWPCFSWLLKAHVEASVEFSILLSGLIVKLGVWGLVRFLPFCEPQAVLLLAVAALLAMVEVTVRLWAQRDLKRVVALTTVFEMNWLVFCLCLGGPTFTAIAGLLAVAHSFTTTTEFFLVECVSRRFGTRDCTELQGLFSTTPLLALFTLLGVLVTIGFPGTSLFTLKLFFFTALCSFSLGVTLVLAVIFLVFLPLFFIRLWAPIWLGLAPAARAVYFDLTAREATLVGVALLGGFVLGWWPSLAYAI